MKKFATEKNILKRISNEKAQCFFGHIHKKYKIDKKTKEINYSDELDACLDDKILLFAKGKPNPYYNKEKVPA